MKINCKNKEKALREVAEKLNIVQNRCSARLFNMEDINMTINRLFFEREKLLTNKLNRKYFKKLIISKYFCVSNSYTWYADTSYITASITKYGKITINVGRTSASKKSYGGYTEDITPIFA